MRVASTGEDDVDLAAAKPEETETERPRRRGARGPARSRLWLTGTGSFGTFDGGVSVQPGDRGRGWWGEMKLSTADRSAARDANSAIAVTQRERRLLSVAIFCLDAVAIGFAVAALRKRSSANGWRAAAFATA